MRSARASSFDPRSCPIATVERRTLARRRLALRFQRSMRISGCVLPQFQISVVVRGRAVVDSISSTLSRNIAGVRALGRSSLTKPLLGRVRFTKDANDELVLPADERER